MYPGKIEPFLEYQEERREQAVRENASTIAKQKQLERFIAKNRAGANTASQARSKQKQLDRLKLNEIAVDEKTAYIQAPVVEPRQGAAVRCEGLAIGYADHRVAEDIHIEIEHRQRTAIVGDNGQGKTTLLRTLVGSLKPLDGEVKWGHGCEIGVYAQHVYSSLPPDETVLEFLEYQANVGTTDQQILAVAGSLLFRDDHVQKKISVLSGGERARLCMAGLLLSNYNILVMDEPGNHLDVETVEALAEALLNYQGTVIFTSHDRHFMKRIATSIIEVRDGCAKNYLGDYDVYLHAMNREIEEGERANNAAKMSAAPPEKSNGRKVAVSASEERKIQKTIKSIERKIARLDDEKKALNQKLLNESNPATALELHNQIAEISKELEAAEETWLELN